MHSSVFRGVVEMAEKEKRISVPYEKQGWNMCSEVTFNLLAKALGFSFDMNKDGEFNQWDVPLIEPGECTIFWDLKPCLDKVANCEMTEHNSLEDLAKKVLDGMPTIIRTRPRGNLPGETHSILVVGVKLKPAKQGDITVEHANLTDGQWAVDKMLIHDPAGKPYEEFSRKRLLREWRATKNLAWMCDFKEEK